MLGEPGGSVDHADRNKLNNTRSNLREATIQQNSQNRSKTQRNSSGCVGVSWHRQHNKWVAYIKPGPKVRHLGIFDTFEDAVKARKSAEVKYFGEFRRKDV